jgi:succinate dehydrogenase / fumarate reductase, cytochrome b subunit
MTPSQAGFFQSSIGKKVVMAVTGLILFGFVVVHMIGNLQVFAGPELLDVYGEKLREMPPLLWGARLVLLVSVALHIWSATSLTRMNRAARPEGYRQLKSHESTYASRTMRWSGVILALFIVYHLMHFTWGNAHPDFRPGQVGHNFIVGFQNPIVSAVYIVAMLLLGLHMYHGVWSMLQTLGLSHPRYNHLRHAFATFITVVVVGGNLSFPIAVLAGVIRETPRTALAPLSPPATR